jgi:hypothetical protein
MSVGIEASHRDFLKAFTRATGNLQLYPNRVWAIAKGDLPKLLPADDAISWRSSQDEYGYDKHEHCTFDFLNTRGVILLQSTNATSAKRKMNASN